MSVDLKLVQQLPAYSRRLLELLELRNAEVRMLEIKNRHPNHPPCHAICVAAIILDVVAKFCTVATNLLKFFSIGSDDGVAFLVGASGVGCAACVGKMYTWSVERATGSGLLVAWAVAVGFNSMEKGFKTSSWGASTISFPLPSSVIKGRIFSWFSLGKTTSHISEDSDNPSDNSIKSSISPMCGCC